MKFAFIQFQLVVLGKILELIPHDHSYRLFFPLYHNSILVLIINVIKIMSFIKELILQKLVNIISTFFNLDWISQHGAAFHSCNKSIKQLFCWQNQFKFVSCMSLLVLMRPYKLMLNTELFWFDWPTTLACWCDCPIASVPFGYVRYL